MKKLIIAATLTIMASCSAQPAFALKLSPEQTDTFLGGISETTVTAKGDQTYQITFKAKLVSNQTESMSVLVGSGKSAQEITVTPYIQYYSVTVGTPPEDSYVYIRAFRGEAELFLLEGDTIYSYSNADVDHTIIIRNLNVTEVSEKRCP